jgi:ADP-ribosyl-[dinitrogen reductase] hydrolase
MRTLSHDRGNPDTEVGRRLTGRIRSSTLPSLRSYILALSTAVCGQPCACRDFIPRPSARKNLLPVVATVSPWRRPGHRWTNDVERRAVGAYLGLAVGDALGATVEFMTPREIRAAYGVHDHIRGGGWLQLPPGQVTDDTTMSLALGRAILASGKVDAHAAARAFDTWMRAKPVDCGHTVRRGILHFRQTGIPEVLENEMNAGNGACMRTLPVALATLGSSPEAVGTTSRAQAHVTHNCPVADAGTECVVLMVHALLQGAPLVELFAGPARALVDTCRPYDFHGRPRENPSGYLVETLQAVFQALFSTRTFRSCVVDVVNRGGDADTTGAIAGMLAGAHYGPEAIPRSWLKALDPDIREQCEEQAIALIACAPCTTTPQ